MEETATSVELSKQLLAAAGIMVMAQNSGAAALIQQGVTVQANLTVGP